MEPRSKKYVHFDGQKTFLDSLEGSSVFQDQISPDHDFGVVVITVDSTSLRETKDLPLNERRLFRMIKNAKDIIKWRAEFTGRDLVVIYPYDDLSKCLTMNLEANTVEIKKCRRGGNFKDQVFAITDRGGRWKGKLSSGVSDGYPSMYNQWAECPKLGCLLGGFGSGDIEKLPFSQNYY